MPLLGILFALITWSGSERASVRRESKGKDYGLQKGCGRLISLNLRLEFPLLLVTSSVGTRGVKFITSLVARTIVILVYPALLSSQLREVLLRLGTGRRGTVGSWWGNYSF